jgi:hypothetical protein
VGESAENGSVVAGSRHGNSMGCVNRPLLSLIPRSPTGSARKKNNRTVQLYEHETDPATVNCK